MSTLAESAPNKPFQPTSLRAAAELARSSYRYARIEASRETGREIKAFPDRCPYSIQQLLDVDWLPK
jgi:hypothetical protein